MPHSNTTAEESGIVTRNRVIDTLRPLLRTAISVERRFSVEDLSRLSGVKVRAIRTYMANDDGEAREPSLSAALSLAVVLGPSAVNAVLAIIGYGGAKPMDDADELRPMQLVAKMMEPFNTIVQAAADDHFDHQERPVCRNAADQMIDVLLPISSHGDAA